jgi:hypothetical protein
MIVRFIHQLIEVRFGLTAAVSCVCMSKKLGSSLLTYNVPFIRHFGELYGPDKPRNEILRFDWNA